jgi:hypothetical protein
MKVKFKEGVLDKLIESAGNLSQFAISLGVGVLTVRYWMKHPEARLGELSVARIRSTTKKQFNELFEEEK